MKNLLALIISFFIYTSLAAQKHDYVWMFGYYNSDFSIDTLRGGVNLDFNYTPAQHYRHLRLAGFNECNTSFCDSVGNLIFYSNGTGIYDRRDSLMSRGDSLNYGNYWEHSFNDSNDYLEGLRIVQSMLSLPMPGNNAKAIIIHFPVNFMVPNNIIPSYLADTLFCTEIDLTANFGFGDVLSKQVKINLDTLSYSNMSAVRHGNGRDWWIIRPYYHGNAYYKFLLTDTGIGLYNIQHEGANHENYGDFGSSCFSPNGEKYFWVTASDGIRMFDFDRCTGTLIDGGIIPFPDSLFGWDAGLVAGIAVSPNNRFLYVTSPKIVLQYDLFAANIGASVDTVAVWDGVYDPVSPLAATFFLAQLGPDGKIYLNSTNGTISLHVINRPDESGDSCLFIQRGVKLNTYNANSLPNFPNYRLGALVGSGCDTLSTLTESLRAEKEKLLKVYPNPAKDVVTVDYGFTDWNKGDVNLEISNTLGQVVYSQSIPRYSGFQRLDVSGFPVGAYQAAIIRTGAVVSLAKFVKE
ncbi:MAG: T9SS type A sorting domain-containing protein [Chitinophagales bacterium]